MNVQNEKAGFICVKDTIDGEYPSLVSGILEGVAIWTAGDFLKYSKDCIICLFT